MVIDRWATRTRFVIETLDAELHIAASPHRHLVVMHPDSITDRPVRFAIRREQHDPCPLRVPSINRPRTHPRLELDPILIRH